jgi:hypothetical protein
VVGTDIEATALQVRPKPGLAVKATVPANPLLGAIETVVSQLFPMRHETVVGLAEMSKAGAGTETVMVAFCVKDPLVPVTFTR